LIPLLLAFAAGAGTYLVFTSAVLGWRGLRPPSTTPGHDRRRGGSRLRRELEALGLGRMEARELGGVVATLFLLGGLGGWALFGGVLPALALGGFTAGLPIAALRHRRRTQLARAQEAWPRMIDEIRVLTSASGRSIPQALFEVGQRAPDELRPAFAAAKREWLLSTDFARTLRLLKARLADPTADAACETLLIAHELGGTDLDGRLDDLAHDRRQDVQGRKDARAKQAGARFARRFVLIVPLGMALAGMSVGNGRAAYQTAFGQVVVVVALALVIACWVWAGLVMRLPDQERVFTS
jgi:tight adherence protein B